MAKMGRPGMSDELRRELWRMWASGYSFSEIARAIGHPPGSIFTVVRQTGGYVPAPSRRRPGTLTLREREEISRGLARGHSSKEVARELAISVRTVETHRANIMHKFGVKSVAMLIQAAIRDGIIDPAAPA